MTYGEVEILKLVLKGYSNRYIANQLGYTEASVRTMLHNIYEDKQVPHTPEVHRRSYLIIQEYKDSLNAANK